MGGVDALWAGLTEFARLVHFGAVLVPGLSATAQNALLPQASCSRGIHGHVRPARAPRADAPPTSKIEKMENS